MLRSTTQGSSIRDLSRFSSQWLNGSAHSRTTHKSHAGKLSIHEDSIHFKVSLEFSSFDETSLGVWVAGHQLTLTADKRSQNTPKDRKTSSFFSCIDLPRNVDEDSITAELKNARLEVRFNKEGELFH